MGLFKNANLDSLQPPERQKSNTILLVDDEPANLNVLAEALIDQYHVLTADNGIEALKLIESLEKPEQIQLIIADQKMPGMSGVDFLEKSIALLPKAQRILLTAYTDVDAVINAINRGKIFKFCLKPFDRQDMLLTVQRALDLYQLAEENQQLITDLKNLNASLEQKVEDRTAQLQDKNREMRDDLFLAGQVQQTIFHSVATPPFVELALHHVPYDQVSGDLYHVDTTPDGACDLFIGDATGHGVAAALITIMATVSLNDLDLSQSPLEVMEGLNLRLLRQMPEMKFITGIYLRIYPTGETQMVIAGHPPPIVVPADGGDPYSPGEQGPILGAFAKPVRPMTQHSVMLNPGDKIFLFTDGCYERRNNAGKIFSLARLREFLANNREAPIQSVVEKFAEVWNTHAERQTPEDDATLMGICFKGYE